MQVIEQWLYGLYYDENTVNNYGWINFDNVTFELTQLTFDELSTVRIINNFRGYVEEGARFDAYEQLPCNNTDKQHWKEFGTWRVPPIILNVNSLAKVDIPNHADIDGNLQLIEGHSRLGYLYAIANCGHKLNEEHFVYLLSYKSE